MFRTRWASATRLATPVRVGSHRTFGGACAPLAGHYVRAAHADGAFSTMEAHKLLTEQGIKLSNGSQSLKNNLTSKRVFKVGSRYKVTRLGMDYLKTVGVSV